METKNRNGYSWVEKIIRRISEISSLIALIFLMGILIITVVDVFLRYFFNSPITGSTEIASYLMLGVGFFGLAWCALSDGHISVDLIVGRFSQRGKSIINIFNYIAVIGVCILIATQSISMYTFEKQINVKSTILSIPQHPFYLIVSVGFILLLLTAIVLLVETVRGMRK